MADAARKKARKVAQAAQAQYTRKQGELEKVQAARRDAFAQAQAAGLSLREIADATDLHWTRVGQIIREQ
jgi:DNA-directed RNA polymerase specialized sigma24 family protein